MRGSLPAQRYSEAMVLGKPSVFEHRLTAGGGRLEARLYPTQAGVSAYYRQAEGRKRAQQEVRATHAALSATLAAITDGFYTLDHEWRVTYLNDKAAELFPGGREGTWHKLLAAIPRSSRQRV